MFHGAVHLPCIKGQEKGRSACAVKGSSINCEKYFQLEHQRRKELYLTNIWKLKAQ